MATLEKRKALDKFCGTRYCSECPLGGPVCRCGSGTTFLTEGEQRMSDEEIEAAHSIVFSDLEPMRHFSTGAIRDDATGKGRYDLLPWGAIHALAQHCERGALHYGERNVDKGIPQHSLIDSGLRHISQYIQGDAEPYHLVAALWNIAWAVEQEIKRPEMVDLPERTDRSGRAV